MPADNVILEAVKQDLLEHDRTRSVDPNIVQFDGISSTMRPRKASPTSWSQPECHTRTPLSHSNPRSNESSPTSPWNRCEILS